MIMRDRIPHRVPRAGLLALGFLALLVLPGWSQDGAPPQKKGDTPKKDTKQKDAEQIFLLDQLRFEGAVTYPQVQTAPTSASQTILFELQDVVDSQDRENRLQALEKRIEALLKEVRALRAGSKPTSTQGAPVEKAKVPAKRVPLNVQLGPVQQIELRRYEYHLAAELANKGHDVVSLARATYKLPHDKAEILAAFFRDHVKAKVMETKVEGDTLTITTTPETQKALDSVIGLVQGKPTAAKDNTGSAVQELSEAVRRNRLEKYRELMEQVEKQRAPGPAKPKQ